MNVIRGLVGVIAGLAVWAALIRVLETALAGALAQQPLSTPEAHAAIAISPAMMVSRPVYSAFVAMPGGYVVARIAAHDPLRYATIAAMFQALILIVGFSAGQGQPVPL